ncbi:hypothetical protein pb186bvf_000059 [Paramecium bursaria]
MFRNILQLNYQAASKHSVIDFLFIFLFFFFFQLIQISIKKYDKKVLIHEFQNLYSLGQLIQLFLLCLIYNQIFYGFNIYVFEEDITFQIYYK